MQNQTQDMANFEANVSQEVLSKKQDKLSFVLIGVILLLLLLFAYAFFQMQSLSRQLQVLQEERPEVLMDQGSYIPEAPVASSYDGWKSFESEVAGVYFQYPGYLFEGERRGGPDASVVEHVEFATNNPVLGSGTGYTFTSYLIENTFESWFESKQRVLFPPGMTFVQSIEVAGTRVDEYSYVIPSPERDTGTLFVFAGDRYAFAIQAMSYLEPTVKNSREDIDNLILSIRVK